MHFFTLVACCSLVFYDTEKLGDVDKLLATADESMNKTAPDGSQHQLLSDDDSRGLDAEHSIELLVIDDDSKSQV